MSFTNRFNPYFIIRFFIILILGILLFSYTGCNKSEPIPTYISIDSLIFNTNPSLGTRNHKITHVWVYADDILLGAYPYPARIPVFCNGEQCDIRVYPGIRNNGSSQSPDLYPLMDYYSKVIPFKAGEWQNIVPILNYNANCRPLFMENFDQTNQFNVDLDNNVFTTQVPTAESFEGLAALKTTCTSANPLIEVANNSIITNLPTSAQTPVYLELNYKCDLPMAVGYNLFVNGSAQKVYFVILNPKQEWNKVYINLSEQLSKSGVTGMQLFFSASYTEYKGAQQEAHFWIDNVKLLRL